jgi:hypothetical protein
MSTSPSDEDPSALLLALSTSSTPDTFIHLLQKYLCPVLDTLPMAQKATVSDALSKAKHESDRLDDIFEVVNEHAKRLAMGKFGSELRFEPEPMRTGPKVRSKGALWNEPNLKSGSRFTLKYENKNGFEPIFINIHYPSYMRLYRKFRGPPPSTERQVNPKTWELLATSHILDHILPSRTTCARVDRLLWG